MSTFQIFVTKQKMNPIQGMCRSLYFIKLALLSYYEEN